MFISYWLTPDWLSVQVPSVVGRFGNAIFPGDDDEQIRFNYGSDTTENNQLIWKVVLNSSLGKCS